MGWLSFNNQSRANPENLNRVFYHIGESNDQWNIKQIIPFSQRPVTDFSGLWWGGGSDTGWGISLNFVERGELVTVVATFYLYDESGNPRWLIGTQSGFETNQDITIAMEQVNGYGRMQNQVELTRVPAGTITLNLKQASRNFDEAGVLSMDILYPDDQTNDNWVRNNIPFAMFSKPRE